MRIDNECVRDILFVIEDKVQDTDKSCRVRSVYPDNARLQKYDYPKVAYHVRYLEMKGLIYVPNKDSWDSYDLTPDGHEFLANVRDDNNWKKIKNVSSSIGFASLKIISAIAEGVATAAINQHLGFTDVK